jgi:hypothetical protein
MYQPTQLKKTTTPSVQNSIKRSSSRYGFLLSLLISAITLAAAGPGGTANAAEPLPPPTCPGKDCQKVITIYNNTDTPIFVVIQAGQQNPDPWLQAYFGRKADPKTGVPYAETHYSRAYINPANGIKPGEQVSVTVPWWSELIPSDKDHYTDWYNGGRIVVFDTKRALDAALEKDKESGELSVTDDSPKVSCKDCEQPLTIYKPTEAIGAKEIPFQLVEYTFAQVGTTGPLPVIEGLNVGYNTSYLDQIYLPVALAPCRFEPCDPNVLDPSAKGYLGTLKQVKQFREKLTAFSDREGWPRYKGKYDNNPSNPRLPGAYNVLIDQVNIANGHESHFTPAGQSITDLIDQWKTCTSPNANDTNCPDYKKYQKVNKFFKDNYDNYIEKGMGNARDCPQNNDPLYYPVPKELTALNIMPPVYGWVQFNSGCSASFNDLAKFIPDNEKTFKAVQSEYITYLQYNFENPDIRPKQRFNPFVDLIHGQLDATCYAFSVDDTAGFQIAPGQGLIIAIGGSRGLPNTQPVELPANFKHDFEVQLGDSVAQNRPRWKDYGVCSDKANEHFQPLPPDATRDARTLIVDTFKRNISENNPCTITVTDAKDRKFQFVIRKRVPWAAYDPDIHPPPRFESEVLECVNTNDPVARQWCNNLKEQAKENPPQFTILTEPPPE